MPERKKIDPEAVKAAARADYAAMRELARKPDATVTGTGAEIDAEVDRRTRAHVDGMDPTKAAEFLQIYNSEYNRLVMGRLQQQTGCAVPIIIGTLVAMGVLISAVAVLA